MGGILLNVTMAVMQSKAGLVQCCYRSAVLILKILNMFLLAYIFMKLKNSVTHKAHTLAHARKLWRERTIQLQFLLTNYVLV